MPFVAPEWCERTSWLDEHADLGHSLVKLHAKEHEGTRVSIQISRYEPLTAHHEWRWVVTHSGKRPGQRRTGDAFTFFDCDIDPLLEALEDIDDIPEEGWRWYSHGNADIPGKNKTRKLSVVPNYSGGNERGIRVQSYAGILPPPIGVVLSRENWKVMAPVIEWACGGDWGDPEFVRPQPVLAGMTSAGAPQDLATTLWTPRGL